MTNLKNIHTIWESKLRAGEKKIMMIVRDEDDWYLLTEKRAEQILSLAMAINGEAGLRPENIYSIDCPDTDNLWAKIMIKDERELLVEDQNGLYAFGVDGVEPPAPMLFLYFRTEQYHGFVFADRDGCSVRLLPAMQGVIQDDLVPHMADMFIPSAES
jgi:hypothetical protein